jgi:adenosine deaminase CECR1
MEAYMLERERLIEGDYKAYGLPKLSDQEKIADTKLNIMKQEFLNHYSLDDILDFWALRESVKSSRLFDIVKRMPKGASLHIHGIASVDGEWVYENLVKEPNVYINSNNYHLKVLKKAEGDYIPIEVYLESPENVGLIKQKLQLNKDAAKGGPNKIWKRFQEMFFVLGNLLNYHTNFKKYMLKSLQEFVNDNVSRVEFRHMLGFVYNDEGYLGLEAETEFIRDIYQEFLRENPGFSFALIICGYKAEEPSVIAEKVIMIYELVKKYPGFVLGYDLVGVRYI